MPMRLDLTPRNGDASSSSVDDEASSKSNGMHNGGVLNDLATDSDYCGSSRLETTRLIIQALHELGYTHAASALEAESNCSIESNEVVELRAAVLSGRWTESERLLGAVELKPDTNMITLKFLIRQQKYLELLEHRQLNEALDVLRNELSVLERDPWRLHALSRLIMCTSAEDLRSQSFWSGVDGDSRELLLRDLQRSISPAIMIPEHRLASLLTQAKTYQKLSCTYHNYDGDVSLYSDHVCDSSELPRITSRVLTGHSGEVWFVAFSHDGMKLAAAVSDGSVVIWDMRTFTPLRINHSTKLGVGAVAWSPNDDKMVTCGMDGFLKLWDLKDNTCLWAIEFNDKNSSSAVTSCAWLPSGEQFFVGSLNLDRSMALLSLSGQELHKWEGFRAYDLALTPNGKKLVVITNENRLCIYCTTDYSLIAEISLDVKMSCVTISQDSQYALVHNMNHEVHLWDIDKVKLVRKAVGQQQDSNIIRSCFGGVADDFLLSGSEDSNIYVWKKDDARLIEILKGHTKAVSTVAWNPKDRHMFASGSDDHTVRIWTNRA
ncbi:WD40-repeat-containing domain protein [Limtongia smithiae]|uniref:WD40-repeat-containing domain protein n=1 Tax=Limtongia smithiae TaxID=1125753 RepID=UPI0034CDCF97